jgi:hypothetical protein
LGGGGGAYVSGGHGGRGGDGDGGAGFSGGGCGGCGGGDGGRSGCGEARGGAGAAGRKKKNTLRRCGCVERGHASARVSTRVERTNARRSAVDAKTQTALLRELGGCRRYRLI